MDARISTIFPLLLITLLCVGGVEVLYLGVERYLLDPAISEQSAEDVVAVPTEDTARATEKPVDYVVITKRNLFGAPPQKKNGAGEVAPPPEELEATTLDVVLMGTIGGGEQGSRAIILNKKDRKQELYELGDTVQGAVIKEIQRGKVILHINDRDEMLDMSEAANYAKSYSRPVAANPALRRRRTAVASPSERSGVAGRESATRRRVVRPTRRIVQPRPVVDTEEVTSEVEPVTEELAPELQLEEAADLQEQDAGDQQDLQDQGGEDQQDLQDQEAEDQQDIQEQNDEEQAAEGN